MKKETLLNYLNFQQAIKTCRDKKNPSFKHNHKYYDFASRQKSIDSAVFKKSLGQG
jgi:hypothetical protein